MLLKKQANSSAYKSKVFCLNGAISESIWRWTVACLVTLRFTAVFSTVPTLVLKQAENHRFSIYKQQKTGNKKFEVILKHPNAKETSLDYFSDPRNGHSDSQW